MNDNVFPTELQKFSQINDYFVQGWKLTPIRHGSKSPMGDNWNHFDNAVKDVFHLPPSHGVGLCHAWSGTMALDIDDMFRASLELSKHGIDLHKLFSAPDSVVIESGNGGHGKLLYAMPFGLALPSKKLIDKYADGTKYNYLDFRCATADGLTVQDVLPPSIHPITQRPYRWSGNGHYSSLPVIPDKLLRIWTDLIAEESVKHKTIVDPENIAEWDEIQEALTAISPDLDRDAWVTVGMALHWVGTQKESVDYAFQLWDSWSSRSAEKYKGTKDLWNAWRSFKPGGGVTVGTLFSFAYDAGWTRKPVDPAKLFQGVNVEKPANEPLPDWLTTTVEMDVPEWLTPKVEQPVKKKLINILDGLRPVAPNLDLDLFPKVIRRRAEEVAESIGADPLVPLFAGLSAVAGALDSRTRLELAPKFQVAPVLWCMTIGNPADKKSPASRPMFKVLKELEQEDRPNHDKRVLEWEGKEAAYASAHKAFLEYHSDPLSQLDNDSQPQIPELPPRPVPLKITVSDITSQKLVRHAADRPRGLLCYLDEMQSWVKKVSDPRSGEDRSAWVQAYESEAYEMDRVGAGSIYAENLAVSIYGNIQPRVFRESIKNLSSDGLLQRFIPVMLRPEMTRLGNPIPDFLTNETEYNDLIRRTYALPVRTYTLSPNAYRIFRSFQAWYENEKYDERIIQTDDTYMTAFGKLEGLAGRVALLMHVIEDPYSQEVSDMTMSKAVRFVKDYIIPSLRYVYGEIGGLSEDSFDAWAANYVIASAGMDESLTLREIKKSARRKLETVPHHARDRTVMDSMLVLETFGWVALAESNPRTNHYVWQINPELKTAFADQRKELIRVKQKRHDEMLKSMGASKRTFVRGYDPADFDDEEDDHRKTG